MFIKDDDCTKNNCQEKLEMFLNKISISLLSSHNKQQIPTTFVFYYGGHGTANGFGTIGGIWTYEQVSQTIEKLFHGCRVLLLLDCCAAGNLCYHLPSTATIDDGSSTNNDDTMMMKKKKKQYVLLASSAPYVTTSAEGDEWILNNSWIQLMRWWGYYVDDNNNNNTDEEEQQQQQQHRPPTLDDQISLLADRTAFEIGDQFFAYFTPSKTIMKNNEDGNSLLDISWMPKRRQQRSTTNDEDHVEGSSSSLLLSEVPSQLLSSSSSFSYSSFDEPLKWQKQIPEKARILSIDHCRVGDSVFYRHPGGIPRSITVIESNPTYYVPPIWLAGTIVSTSTFTEVDCDDTNKLIRLTVGYPSIHEQWEVEVSYQYLMNGFWLSQQWMLPRLFCRAQIMLAQDYAQYLDCSSLVSNTQVQFVLRRRRQIQNRCDDGDQKNDGDMLTTTIQEGTILDWRDFNWRNHIISCHNTNGLYDGDGLYDGSYFNELPVKIKEAARDFGYTKYSWDNDIPIVAESKEWDALTVSEQEAAKMLGYDRQKKCSSIPIVDDSTSKDQSLSNQEHFRIAGPVVPVEWNDDDDNQQSCLVPLVHIILCSEIKGPSNNTTIYLTTTAPISLKKEMELKQPQCEKELKNLLCQTLIRSLESSGKFIGNAMSILKTRCLTVYWPDDEEFYDAIPIPMPTDEDYIDNVELLTSHFEYTLPGVYCPVLYEDGVRCLIPVSYIFKRGDHKRLFSNNRVTEKKNQQQTVLSLTTNFPTQESINNMSTLLLDLSLRASSFGEQFSEIALQLEHASHLLHSAFEKKKNEDGQRKNNKRADQLKEPKKSIISSLTTTTKVSATTTFNSNSTTESNDEETSFLSDEANENTNSTPECDNKSYINYDWSNMPERIKNAAQRIGYNRKIWNADTNLPINEKEWKNLTHNEKEDLKTIGYNEADWDEDEYDNDSDY